MKKYWILFKLAMQNSMVYRTNVLLWRFRQLISTLMALTVWRVIFSEQNTVFNYSGTEMNTYVFVAAFLQSLILATALNGLSNRIYSGQLSSDLVKPLNIFANLASEELADKLKNVSFLILETILLWWLFKPTLSLPDASVIIIFLAWVLGGLVLNFLITLLFGALGFWSPDTWGPKFLFITLVDLSAGKLFPLDIFPKIIQSIIMLTPFPYFAFLQSQLFLEKLTPTQITKYSLLLIFWIILFAFIVKKTWQRGIKDYTASGQ